MWRSTVMPGKIYELWCTWDHLMGCCWQYIKTLLDVYLPLHISPITCSRQDLLYVHIRIYYMRTACAPYSSVSLGGWFAPKDTGIHLDFSTGVDYRVNKKLQAHFSIVFCLSKFTCISTGGAETDYCSWAHLILDIAHILMWLTNMAITPHHHINLTKLGVDIAIKPGYSLRLGISFQWFILSLSF